MANAKNLASGKLAESISASTSNILVYVGNGSASTIEGVFPTAPFYITVMPANPSATVANSLDSEIMLITAVGHDQVGNVALTATRAQRGTTAKAFNSGSIITLGIYSEDTVFMSEDGTSETPTPWINATDIIWSSMYYAYMQGTVSARLTTSWETYGTIDISSFPTGSVVEVDMEIRASSGTSNNAGMYVAVGCSEAATGDGGVGMVFQWSGIARHTFTFVKTTHSTLELRAYNDNTSVTIEGTYFRISAKRVK